MVALWSSPGRGWRQLDASFDIVDGPKRDELSYGQATDAIGHNPLGGLSVAAMILALCTQVGLGLFAEDNDGLLAGPLSGWVDARTAERITDLHEIMFWVLVALIVLHVAAILFYAIARRRNLVTP